MTFEEVVKKYPLHTTYVGRFYYDEHFTAHSYDDIKDIDRWDYAPLDWDSGILPFIYYNEAEDKFDCWVFSYYSVEGYINETINPNNFYPAVFTEEWNWEKVNINNTEDIILVEPENIDKDYEYLERVEQAAKVWDEDAFKRGKIFCTYDAIKNYFANK